MRWLSGWAASISGFTSSRVLFSLRFKELIPCWILLLSPAEAGSGVFARLSQRLRAGLMPATAKRLRFVGSCLGLGSGVFARLSQRLRVGLNACHRYAALGLWLMLGFGLGRVCSTFPALTRWAKCLPPLRGFGLWAHAWVCGLCLGVFARLSQRLRAGLMPAAATRLRGMCSCGDVRAMHSTFAPNKFGLGAL